MAGGLEQTLVSWQNQGLKIAALTLLLNGPGSGPPSTSGALLW
jgi:hypothetical protein